MLYRFDGKQPVIGRDVYVSDSARVIGDVVVGDGCYIGHGAILRGDYGRIEIGAGSAVEEGAILHAPPGDVNRVGQSVTVGHGAVLHAKSVGDCAVIGMGAVISIWAEIGSWSIVAEGAVVRSRQVLPDRVVAAGNPAKIVRKLTEKDVEFWTWGKQVYVDLARKYLAVGLEPLENPPAVRPRKERSNPMSVTLEAIGTAHTEAAETPRHWTVSEVEGTLVVDPAYTLGLSDIEAGQQIVVLFHFHESPPFSPHLLQQTPPHRDRPKGVFSICSPRRPNPVGLSVLEVLEKKENVLRVRRMDMIDGTPILDIKPFVVDEQSLPSREGRG